MRRYYIVEQCKIRTESEATTWPRFSSFRFDCWCGKSFFSFVNILPFPFIFPRLRKILRYSQTSACVVYTILHQVYIFACLLSEQFFCVREFSSSLSISFFFSLDLRHQHLSQRLRIPIQKLYLPSRHRKQWETAHSWRSKMWVAHHSLRPFHSHPLLALRLRLRVLLVETTNLIQTESEVTSPYKKEWCVKEMLNSVFIDIVVSLYGY